MIRWPALFAPVLLLSSHTLEVGAGTAADFKAWAVDEAARASMQAPLPPMLDILPGMTQISLRIDPAVRDAMAKLLRDFPKGKRALTHDEFAVRWADIEPDLATVTSIPEAVKVLEDSGRRKIEEVSLELGLFKSAENIKGAEAATFYVWGDTQRKEWLSAAGWRIDSQLNQTILNHLNQRTWGRKLSETQKTKICNFALMLNKDGLSEREVESNIGDIWLQYKKKYGSSLPESKEIMELLKASKVLKK
ncbi:MAG: hypothetical protein AB7F75_06375 [Planctomycetota bacterium]